MSHVLVINQDHTPLTVCTVERAFMLLFLNKAELISAIEDRKLRSISKSFPFPSVIKTQRYINVPHKGIILTRQNVFKRDNHTCQYCQTKYDLTLDHVIPRSKGGKTTWTNLVTACRNCNARKSDYSLEEADMRLMSMPKKPTFFGFIKNSGNILQQSWLPYLDPKSHVA